MPVRKSYLGRIKQLEADYLACLLRDGSRTMLDDLEFEDSVLGDLIGLHAVEAGLEVKDLLYGGFADIYGYGLYADYGIYTNVIRELLVGSGIHWLGIMDFYSSPARIDFTQANQFAKIIGRDTMIKFDSVGRKIYIRNRADSGYADVDARTIDANEFLYGNRLQLTTYGKIGKVSSLPSPSSSLRGEMIRIQGGTGVADEFHICMKNAKDAYYWEQLV